MNTNFVTVWQESISGTNWDIWGRFECEPNSQPFFQTDSSSKYPHINGYFNPNPWEFYCYTTWTEEITPSLYEVKFGYKRYIPQKSVSDIPYYYAVEIGDTNPSPYCVQRTGYLRYNPISIDYGNQKLKYKLPYLHPSYYYDLRAIIYQQGQDNWSQEFDIDSASTTTITFEPNRPETVWIRLPQESYMNDAKVNQEIRKILGNRAVIADLRLYQREILNDSGGGSGPQSAGMEQLLIPTILRAPKPNPFANHTTIRFQIPVKTKVDLKIYNSVGRLVNTLISDEMNPGYYTMTWSSKDEQERTQPNGIYFVRLKTKDYDMTKKMVMVK
jgi:hypothetical protein